MDNRLTSWSQFDVDTFECLSAQTDRVLREKYQMAAAIITISRMTHQ
jgi:hypothetical protein